MNRYTLKQVADYRSRWGWDSPLGIDEFVRSLETIDRTHIYFCLAAGAVEHLKALESLLDRAVVDLAIVRMKLCEEPEAPPDRDPIADARRACLLDDPAMILDFDADCRDLTIRARKAIRRSGCVTAGELARFGRSKLVEIKGVGMMTMDEIEGYLQDRWGLQLGP